jgi:hypothetical protein
MYDHVPLDTLPPELWHVGATSCRMTRANEPPPFVVELYDGDVLRLRHEFPFHDDAAAFAIEALRTTSPSNS